MTTDPTRTAQHYEPIYGELVQIGMDAEGMTRAIIKIDREDLKNMEHVPMYMPVQITVQSKAVTKQILEGGDSPATERTSEPTDMPQLSSDPTAAAPVSATVEQRHRQLARKLVNQYREPMMTDSDQEAQLLADFEAKAVAQATAELQNENDFLHDLMSAFEWRRINAMDAKEVEKELLDAGYTREQLAAGLAKVRKIAEDAINKSKEHNHE